jgi:hypothetical protein
MLGDSQLCKQSNRILLNLLNFPKSNSNYNVCKTPATEGHLGQVATRQASPGIPSSFWINIKAVNDKSFYIQVQNQNTIQDIKEKSKKRRGSLPNTLA